MIRWANVYKNLFFMAFVGTVVGGVLYFLSVMTHTAFEFTYLLWDYPMPDWAPLHLFCEGGHLTATRLNEEGSAADALVRWIFSLGLGLSSFFVMRQFSKGEFFSRQVSEGTHIIGFVVLCSALEPIRYGQYSDGVTLFMLGTFLCFQAHLVGQASQMKDELDDVL